MNAPHVVAHESSAHIMLHKRYVLCSSHFMSRFDISGVHPQSRMPGTYTQVPYCKKATSELVGY